jgi:hypothetical protein
MTDLFSNPDHTLDAQGPLPGAGNDGAQNRAQYAGG